jgi:predicted acyl esterase
MMRQQSMTRPRNLTSQPGGPKEGGSKAGGARPLSPGAVALGRAAARGWSLPPRRNRVAVEYDVEVPMSDGTVLLATHYIPVSVASAATVLVRCPYGRTGVFALQTGQILAERGYHVLLQSVRGTFGSGGDFEPMRHEITDGQDTVAWLRQQSWFEGRLATYGPSYLGFVQWALAMDPPPELVAAVVHVGPHDFSRSAYRNGAFDLYNYVMWSDLVAHQESTGMLRAMVRMATAERRLRQVLQDLPVAARYADVIGREPAWSERWMEHPQASDPFWAPMQCGPALERITAPVLLVGGWQDLFIEQTLEQYRTLAGACPSGCSSDPGPTWTSPPRVPSRSTRASPGSTATPAQAVRLLRVAPIPRRNTRCVSGSAARARSSGARSAGGRRPVSPSSAGTWAPAAHSGPLSRPGRNRPRAGRPPASATTRPTPRRRRVVRSSR